MFRTVPLSIIRSFSPYTQQWYMSYRFADRLRAGALFLLAICQQICVTYTIAVCTVKNPLMVDRGTVRNTQSLIPRIKFEKLMHLVGFIIGNITHVLNAFRTQIYLLKILGILLENYVLILLYVSPVIRFHLSSLEVSLHFKEQMLCLSNPFKALFEPQHYTDGNSDFSATDFWRQEETET